MMRHLKSLIALLGMLLIVNMFLPAPKRTELAGGLEGITGKSVTVSYQRGDGKGNVSETDDGTISSRYTEGIITRSLEFQGDGGEMSLLLKRVKNISGGETTVETRRTVIKFPNIIGDEANQIPLGAKIESAALKLVTSAIDAPNSASMSAYRIMENWTETESGNLKSPSWRNRHSAENENDTAQGWTNFGADTPMSSELLPIAEAAPISYLIGNTVSVDATKAVQEWTDGKPNNGMMLKLFDEKAGGTLRLASFYSSEWEMVNLRPLLEITYAAKTVIPPTTTAPEQSTTTPVSSETPPQQLSQETIPTPTTTPPTIEITVPEAPLPQIIKTPEPIRQVPLKTAPATKQEKTESPQIIPATPELPSASAEQKTESDGKPSNKITPYLKLIQKNILKTWARIINLFR